MIKYKLGIIRNVFADSRNMEYVPEDEVLVDDFDGDVFITEDNELVLLRLCMSVFDESVLASTVCAAEDFYTEYDKRVNMYIISLNGDVTVRECNIKSFADFTIKLGVAGHAVCSMILESIKSKFNDDGVLSENDLDLLGMLPLMCARDEREFYRKEYLCMLNKVDA